MQLKIDIGVGGRFHADRLAQVFLDDKHDVRVVSTYPRSRFPQLAGARLVSQPLPEIAFRLLSKLGAENQGDLLKMHWFGHALAAKLRRDPGQLFIGWSSFSLETLRAGLHPHRALLRDSTHYRTQMRILEAEARLHGETLPDRSLVLDREEEEYALADTIFVLSRFARKSFIDHGIAPEKLHILPLGADTSRFAPVARDPFALPLRLVYFGSVSLRKGIPYLLQAIDGLPASLVGLTVIGPVEPCLLPLQKRFSQVRWLPPMDHAALAAFLPTQDVFVLPTLEDGFGQTLPQAMACGLVPITTDRCGAAESLAPGEGFIVEAANAQALRDAIQSAAGDLAALWRMRETILKSRSVLGWDRYRGVLREWLEQVKPGIANESKAASGLPPRSAT